MRRRHLLRLFTVLSTAMMAAAMGAAAPQAHAAPPAQAAPQAEAASPRVLDVAVAPNGFAAPDRVPAGPLRLRVTTTDEDGAWLGLVRLRHGVAMSAYLAHLRQAMGDDPRAALVGARQFATEAEVLGGVAVTPTTSATLLADVSPGPLLLVDYRDHAEPDLAARVRRVDVLGTGSAAGLPRTSVHVRHVDTATGVRFETTERWRAGQPVTVTNCSNQPNEAMLMRVRDGATEADLHAFYTALDGGEAPDWSVFTSRPVGVVPLSPGRSAVLATDLAPGRYGLVTWVRDLVTGRYFGALGASRIIEVVPR